MLNSVSRRTFIKGGAGVAAAAMAAPLFIPQKAFGANDAVVVAVLGVNGRGKDHIEGFEKQPNVRLTTLCDPDAQLLAERAKSYGEKYQKTYKTVKDLRTLFDDKEIDAVSIAMPNHWHSLATIWACQAGKDVYVEKP
ncbi:MAG: twin-arginine translocation signal domain-containing protein, partial [Calditrichaeota bacterium]